jgi:hypothetical protein
MLSPVVSTGNKLAGGSGASGRAVVKQAASPASPVPKLLVACGRPCNGQRLPG